METLRYVVLANVLLLVVSLAYYALLRRETFFSLNRLILWLGVTATLLLPLLELPDWRPQPIRHVMHRTAQVVVPRLLPAAPKPDVTITFPNSQTYPAFQAQPAGFAWSWPLILIMFYLAGVGLLLIRFGVQVASLMRLIRRSAHEVYDDFTLVHNESVTSPFSFFNWVVLNPNQHTPDEFDQILRHERVHVRERHSLDMLGAELVCILFWFNPAVYLFRHLLHQTLEFRADRSVLAEGIDARAYQYNLVKVSLSVGQTSLTNHFSKSQLKSRIDMLNKPNSPKTAWLNYAVLVVVVLTVTAAFARHPFTAISTSLPKPRTSSTSVKTDPQNQDPQVLTETEPVVMPDSVEPEIETTNGQELAVEPVNSQTTTVPQTPVKDSARVSPSRYMRYEGDFLYWIVTPKTTFDDFAVMKKEFEKHGNQMQLNELKYDLLYAYINRINFTVKRPFGGLTNCKETDDDSKPIPTIAGYVGIGTKSNTSGTGGLRYYKTEFPGELRAIAAEDEKATDQFVKTHKLDYLMLEAEQKFKSLGSGAASYAKNYIQKYPIENNSGLIVNPDGSLSVNEKLGNVKLFVNNESIGRNALNDIKVSQLYSVVQKSQYNPARKESFIAALLIYVTEDN